MTYRSPVRDILFTLTEAAGFERLLATGAYPDLDLETASAVVTAAGQFADEVLAPLNRSGDLQGATYANGAVTAAPGFREAYKAFADGGWGGLAGEPQFGGQGLPKALEHAAFECVHAANMAFGLCPMLTLAGIEALQVYGTDKQKKLYLPKLISGEWTGAMVLTEPQAGSDLGTLRTTAKPNGDGTYALDGQKIFITWGDHDVAANIVHFVLARMPDAPAGTKGISLFLTSKLHVDGEGKLGARNAFRPVGVEHKLGIHASPTCVMAYEGATAELIGEPNQGLAHMFTMMNAARLAVGMEGVAIAERAWAQAFDYARERKQGRSAWTGEASAPIFDHPDVRRMLAVAKAKIEAARAICLTTAVCADLAKHASKEADAAAARRREDLFVPIAKAWSTDIGVEVASIGVQVHGGMGFIEETGAAQHYRDARIAPIYEGTNGIQAIDLVGRKLSSDGGEGVHELCAEIRETVSELSHSGDPRLAHAAGRLVAAVGAVETATAWVLKQKATSQPDVLAAARPYLQLLGETAGGWMLAKGALSAADRLKAGDGDPTWLGGKLDLLTVYADQVLTGAPGLAAAVCQGAEPLQRLSAEALAV
jgi:alkylation response protein AidB-like acyl-CoA dehydrogenase